MPQAALTYTNQEQENSCKIIQFPKVPMCFSQMEATDETVVFDQMDAETESKIHKGMNNFPIDVYNQMIEYSLQNGKIRNAMFFICMANWGMRYSDVVRVRFGYLFDREGRFKDNFSLPNGEQKTKKIVVYYNNKATETIISLYLNTPEGQKKSRLDYLFVSESPNKTKASVQQLEAEDLYNPQIESVQKALDKLPDTEKSLLEKYIKGKITDDNFNYMSSVIKEERKSLEQQLSELEKLKTEYVSPTPNASNIYIQTPMTPKTGQNLVKNTVDDIGIVPKNRVDKTKNPTTEDKYNTHSLRKTFADWFIKTGDELISNGELAFSDTILDLLKEKFKHSSRSVTTHYTDAQERAFKMICQNLNIGLDAVENYMNNQ